MSNRRPVWPASAAPASATARTTPAPSADTPKGRKGGKRAVMSSEGKAKPRHLESQMQRQAVAWFGLQHAPLAPYLLAIPNGGTRAPREAANLKREGVRPGVPDLLFAYPSGQYHGLWMELKVPPNKPTPEQRAYLERLAAVGFAVVVVTSFEQFQATISDYLSR